MAPASNGQPEGVFGEHSPSEDLPHHGGVIDRAAFPKPVSSQSLEPYFPALDRTPLGIAKRKNALDAGDNA